MDDDDGDVITLRSQEQRQLLKQKPVVNTEVVLQDDEVTLDEIDDMDALIRQRETEIKNIQKKVVEVNGLFRQVAEIVANDSHLVDSIETHIKSASVHVEQGKKEIQKAAQTQEDNRKTTAIAAGVGTTIGVVAILAIFLGLKH